MGGGIKTSVDETTCRSIAINGADAFYDPVRGHWLRLTNPPMHPCDLTCRDRIKPQIADGSRSMLAQLDAIVDQATRLELCGCLLAEIAIGELAEGWHLSRA
jgi:hypothetical protein